MGLFLDDPLLRVDLGWDMQPSVVTSDADEARTPGRGSDRGSSSLVEVGTKRTGLPRKREFKDLPHERERRTFFHGLSASCFTYA